MKNSNNDAKKLKSIIPLISVLLPVHNGEKYLNESIDSVLAQSFTNFELIMINDGSTDNSQHILRKFEACDSRVRVVVRENRGLATTLNDSLEIARGEWIARMDQDDIALPNRFERQLQWLKQTNTDICGSWVRRFGTFDKRVVRLKQTDESIKMEMLFCSPFAHPSVMMRTALVKHLRYDKSREKAEDYDLWERAAEAGFKMTNVPEVLLLYRVHSGQISNQAATHQLQQSQEIRRRYWNFVFNSMQINRLLIDETMKIFSPSLSEIDMNVVNESFSELISKCHGDSRDLIFDNVTRLYFKVAAYCPHIVFNWDKLNRKFGTDNGFLTKFQLSLFSIFKIHSDGIIFKQLRKIYLSRSWHFGGQ